MRRNDNISFHRGEIESTTVVFMIRPHPMALFIDIKIIIEKYLKKHKQLQTERQMTELFTLPHFFNLFLLYEIRIHYHSHTESLRHEIWFFVTNKFPVSLNIFISNFIGQMYITLTQN